MGLERFLVGRFGTTPQIDLDKQIARSRVPEARQLRFDELADAVVRNNMGCGGFKFQAIAAVKNDQVILEATGQSFPLKGALPENHLPIQRWMRIHDWADPSKTSIEILK